MTSRTTGGMTALRGRRNMTIHASAAKAIRKEIKDNFPTVPFSVTSRSYAGGDSVYVRWTDGPTTDQVEKIINKYQEGSFDSSRDLYEYTNINVAIPQVKYVQTSRDVSEPFRAKAAELLAKAYNVERLDGETHKRLFGCFCLCTINRLVHKCDLTGIMAENLSLDIKNGQNILIYQS